MSDNPVNPAFKLLRNDPFDLHSEPPISYWIEAAARLTGRPVYDRKDMLIQAQKAAILALVRGYDTGNLSEEDMNKARELLK